MRIPRIRIPRTTAIAAMTLIFILSLRGLSGASAGKFTVVEGRVDTLKPGQARALAVRKGDEVSPGDAVRTKKNSFAEIVFNDGATLKIAGNSRVVIKDYTLTDTNERKSGTLRLLRGKIRATVPRLFGGIIPVSGRSNFEVETPTAVAGVRGTNFFMFYSLGLSGIAVEDGIVEAMNTAFPAIVQRVRGGQIVIIYPERPAPPPSLLEGFELARHERDTSSVLREGADESIGVEVEAGENIFHPEGEYGEGPSEEVLEGEYLNIPVTEEHTELLEVESAFSGNMVASSSTLTLASSVTGDWGDSGTYTMDITNGAFTDTCVAACTYDWSGTIAGTNADGTVFTGTVSGGTWSGNAWTAAVSGTTFNGTEAFSGSLSGTYSGAASGTFSGTGAGRVD